MTAEYDLSAARTLVQRLDKPMGARGVLFALVGVGQSLTSQSSLSVILTPRHSRCPSRSTARSFFATLPVAFGGYYFHEEVEASRTP